MTDREIHERYSVPMEIIREYDSMLRDTGGPCSGQYGEADLRRMSEMMSLYGLDFSPDEVRTYMELSSSPDERCVRQLCGMLDKRRRETLDEIHVKEARISRMDYLRHELERSSKRK